MLGSDRGLNPFYSDDGEWREYFVCVFFLILIGADGDLSQRCNLMNE